MTRRAHHLSSSALPFALSSLLTSRASAKAVLSSVLLLAVGPACTSRDTPPPPAEEQPVEDEPPEVAPVPPGEVSVVDAPAPEGSSLEWVRANACEDGAPMSLTASDGTGLRLASLTARAVVEGPLAFTELRLSFDNPEDRQLEGRFAITLPPGAAISRFAMQIGERWQEGEVVERQAARRAYEDFLHRRQDPALLEKDAGNVFRARVFPIPPRARKELILSYSQELVHEAEPYRLPLCGLPTLDLLDVDVAIVQGATGGGPSSSLGGQATTVYHLDLKREDLAPTQDLEARLGQVPAQGLRYGDLAVARVVPVLESPAEPISELTILMDTSASRALDFSGQVDRLGQLVAALPGETNVHVVAYDQRATHLYSGPATGFNAPQLEGLRQRGALGASDLSQALAQLPTMGVVSKRLLLVGDGVVTAGVDESGELQERLRGLIGDGLTRVDALIDGGIQDEQMLTALTRAGLPSDGVVLDARLEASTIADRLGQATRSDIKVSVPGAEWVYPTVLDGIQSGDERLVYAQLPPEVPMQVELSGIGVRDPEPALAVVPEPLLARAHAQARIADLTARRDALPGDDAQRRKTMAEEIVALSTRHRVLSDFTALLVLETEADYARFNIDRRALADILIAGRSGVERLRRVAPPEPGPEPEPVPEDDPVDAKPKPPLKKAASADKAKGGAKDGDGGDFAFKAEEEEMEMPTAQADVDNDDEAGGLGRRMPMDSFGRGEGGPDDIPAAPADDGVIGLGGSGAAPGNVEPTENTLIPSAPPPAEPERVLEEPRAVDRRRSGSRRERPRPSRRPPPSTGSSPSLGSPLAEVGARGTPPTSDPYTGRLRTVMEALGRGDIDGAEREALAWRKESPGDVLALVALGEVREAQGRLVQAARVYGSIIDLFPSRADLRRMAGERLERLGGAALVLAIDTYAHGVEQRPDHPSSHRLYAYALLKAGRHADAFAAIEASLDRSYPGGRFRGVQQVLREDLGLIGAAWVKVDPSATKKVEASVRGRGATLPTGVTTRFVLNWETDANDVDLHVYDAKGGHAFYSSKTLGSGGRLYADVTTGYGPECFAIEGKRKAGPYTVMAHYYRRGPMGYGMGKLQVVEHDGSGGLRFSEHPFVIMKDDGYVKLTEVGRTLTEPAAFATTWGDPAKPLPEGVGVDDSRDPKAPVIYEGKDKDKEKTE